MEQNTDLSFFKGRSVAILGYSNDCQLHAKELLNSGVKVVIGLKEIDPLWEIAEKDGFLVLNLWNAIQQSDIIRVW